MQQDKTVVARVTQIFITFLILVSCTLVASAETNDSDKYTFTSYGGEVYTPEVMEFGANLNDTEQSGIMTASVTPENETERKHVYLQFYSIPNDTQRGILKNYSVIFVKSSGAYSYVFSMPADYTAADLPSNVSLRWMGEIPVENKYDPLFGLNIPEWAWTEDGQVELWLAFYDDISYEEAEEIAEKYSTSNPNFEMYPYSLDCKITTNETNIPIMVTEDSIKMIVFPEGELVHENSVDKTTPGFSAFISISVFGLAFCLFRKGSEN